MASAPGETIAQVRRIGFASTPTGAARLADALGACEQPLDEMVISDGVAFSAMHTRRLREFSPGDEVVLPDLDALGGSIEDILLALGRADRRGVSIYVVSIPFRTADGQGVDVVRGIRAAAEFESRLVSRRLARDIEAAHQHGAFATGRPRKVTPASVAGLRAMGLGATEIARRLNVSRWTVYRKIRELGRLAAR